MWSREPSEPSRADGRAARRPHCPEMAGVVPEPQVGSIKRSPRSVAMKRQRSMTRGLV
jgi:hypothetical protein